MEAEALLERATMLSPRDSHLWSFHHVRSWVHFALAEYDVAARIRAAREPAAERDLSGVRDARRLARQVSATKRRPASPPRR